MGVRLVHRHRNCLCNNRWRTAYCRIFKRASGALTLQNLTVRNRNASGTNGGAILNAGSLTHNASPLNRSSTTWDYTPSVAPFLTTGCPHQP